MVSCKFSISQNYGQFLIHPCHFLLMNFTHVIFSVAHYNRTEDWRNIGMPSILFIGTITVDRCGQLACLLGTGKLLISFSLETKPDN